MIIRKKWMKKKTIFLSVMVLAGAFFTSNLLARSYTMECKGGTLKVLPSVKAIRIIRGDGQFKWLDRALNDAEKDSLNKYGLIMQFPHNSNYTFDVKRIVVEKNNIKEVKFFDDSLNTLVNKVLNGEQYFLQVERKKGKFYITKIGL